MTHTPTPADVERLIAETEAALKGVTTLADGNAWPSTVALIIGLRDNSIALIAALRAMQAEKRELALDTLAASGQAQEAYEAQLAAEAKLAEVEKERDEQVADLNDVIVMNNRTAAQLEATVATLTAQVEAMRGALEWQEKQRCDAFARRYINAPEDPHVAVLCERYGYGAVMDAASRLWARKDSIGAFYIGGCIGMKPDAALTTENQTNG